MDRELPKAYVEFRKSLELSHGKAKAAVDGVTMRETELELHAAQLPVGEKVAEDRALVLLLRSLQFRMQLAQRWLGTADFTTWLLPDGVPVRSVDASPSTPVSSAGAPSTPAARPAPSTPATGSASLEGSPIAGSEALGSLDPPPQLQSPGERHDGVANDGNSDLAGDVAATSTAIVAFGPARSVPRDEEEDPVSKERQRLSNLSLAAFVQEKKRYKVISDEVGDFQPHARMVDRLEQFVGRQTRKHV